jgi:hypothetical protein
MDPNELCCGNCVFMSIVQPPEDKKELYPVPRGFCFFNPPIVFPMPQEISNIAGPLGKKQVSMVPHMMRPVVDATEPMCGRFMMTNEAADRLGVGADEEILCSGTCGEGDCCGSK